MKELFKKVYIKSEADLPTEDGWYSVFNKRRIGGFGSSYYSQELKELWIKDIDWYFQPITEQSSVVVTDEEIEKASNDDHNKTAY